jgi:hypothetical protein
MSDTLHVTLAGSERRFCGRFTVDPMSRARAAAPAHAYDGCRLALVELTQVIDVDLTTGRSARSPRFDSSAPPSSSPARSASSPASCERPPVWPRRRSAASSSASPASPPPRSGGAGEAALARLV